MFVDASALVAILAGELEAGDLVQRLLRSTTRLTSAIAMWEAAVALARTQRTTAPTAFAGVRDFVERTQITVVVVGAPEAAGALDAHARFGKGRHPARLNMGDCFAYACARSHGAPLLYKGDDFALTDIEAA